MGDHVGILVSIIRYILANAIVIGHQGATIADLSLLATSKLLGADIVAAIRVMLGSLFLYMRVLLACREGCVVYRLSRTLIVLSCLCLPQVTAQ